MHRINAEPSAQSLDHMIWVWSRPDPNRRPAKSEGCTFEAEDVETIEKFSDSAWNITVIL